MVTTTTTTTTTIAAMIDLADTLAFGLWTLELDPRAGSDMTPM